VRRSTLDRPEKPLQTKGDCCVGRPGLKCFIQKRRWVKPFAAIFNFHLLISLYQPLHVISNIYAPHQRHVFAPCIYIMYLRPAYTS
jgi:hypothetical protein